ncbi:MAG: tetratricopeptide repeat protein [Flavobacteriales bacterium]|nr:tetratricopeptide repeat protein [Flavobacteriales bacterium]
MRNFLIFFLLAATINTANGQTKHDEAVQLGRQAIELMESGQIDASVELLEKAQKLDPDNISFPYEIGYAYYLGKNYGKAAKVLKGLLDHPKVMDRVYQMLGNAYDMDGKKDKAISAYEAGINKFPNSGMLYLERGIMELMAKDYAKALWYFEKGIEADPEFSSNYYRAAQIYLISTDEFWGLIYGEIFINMEGNTPRAAEISKSMFDVYKSEITFSGDTSAQVSLSSSEINMTAEDLGQELKLPYGLMVYEMVMTVSLLSEKEINLASLHRIRSRFVENYFSMEHDKKYPNILFDLQKEVLDAGHMEAYNYWILRRGDEEEFKAWKEKNEEKWDAFHNWFREHSLMMSIDHRFYRGQYGE